MKVKKLDPNAFLPTRAHGTDAGVDLYALEDTLIPASHMAEVGLEFATVRKASVIQSVSGGDSINVVRDVTYGRIRLGQSKVRTGIAVQIPEGYYGKVSSRSGLAFKSGIFGLDGTIDAGYRGEVGILLYNTMDVPYQVKAGDRVAQLIIIPCSLEDVEEVDELDEGERGDKGFGGTGK